MAITVKNVPVEAHWSIGKVERYHSMIRRIYKIVSDELIGTNLSKDFMLQMTAKAINDTAGPSGLIPTLLVFGAYLRMVESDPPMPSIIQRSRAIQKAMNELRKIQAERNVNTALNKRNGPDVDSVHNLLINSDVVVWREGNTGKGGEWNVPFKLIDISGETCKINLPSGPTDFRSTCVRPYFLDNVSNDTNDIHNA